MVVSSQEVTSESLRSILFTSSLRAGGAERVLSILANFWADQDAVTLATLDPAETDFYELHPAIERISFGALSKRDTGIRRLRRHVERIFRIRRAVRERDPDVVISFMDRTNVLMLLATVALSPPVIVSERIDPRHHEVGTIASLLRRVLYRRAAAVVVQTPDVAAWACEFVPRRNIHVIPNPVARCHLADARYSKRRQMILGVGRLEPQKGFDQLLRAFALCKDRHPDWSVKIVGEGSERQRLEKLAEQLRIDDHIRLVGTTPAILDAFAEAALFVLPSRYEGFPNALLEAMSCGLAVISFDCPSGPRNIIRDGVNGRLVPPDDVDALAEVLDELMSNQRERERLGSSAREVSERFPVDKIAQRWKAVIAEARREKLRNERMPKIRSERVESVFRNDLDS